MRFSYLLALSAAILTASHETVSAISTSDNTKISQGATADSMVESLNPKGFLRSHKLSDEEERAFNAYTAKWTKKLAERVEEGKLPSELFAKYNQKGWTNWRKHKYNLMNAAFLKKYKGGFNEKGQK